MSISHRSEAIGLQKLSYFKYYNIQKWDSKFTLGLSAVKNTDYIKKRFK